MPCPTIRGSPKSSPFRLSSPSPPSPKPPVRLARVLVITTAWVSENTPAEKVTRMLGQDPRLPGLAILQNQNPVGFVSRSMRGKS
ncbi:MAG: hypothetical protein M0T83_08605 [Nitrospiraceae bacterium]|nr:hypothetical protein [Nitrospiraceae bacterium]